MVTIDDLVSSIDFNTITSEEEVRTKIAIPLFQSLGYESAYRAEAFPIYGFEGRTKLNAKAVDIMFFDDIHYNGNRTSDTRTWVQDHSIIAIELKKPAESIDDAVGQAQFYSIWARTGYYAITNGIELSVYKVIDFQAADKPIERCKIIDLPSIWHKLYSTINFEKLTREKNEARGQRITELENPYDDYCRYYLLQYENRLRYSINRLLTHSNSFFSINVVKKPHSEKEDIYSYEYLIESNKSSIVLAEPGMGKSHLLNVLASDMVKNNITDSSGRIPILINARLWKRSYKTINEAIFNELSPFILGCNIQFITNGLINGKYLILLDGLDELQNDVDTFNDEIKQILRYEKVQIIATCRVNEYYGIFSGLLEPFYLLNLDDSQIETYAENILGEKTVFRSKLSKSIWDLIHNPLFLTMTIEIIKNSSDRSLPRNKAELYLYFNRYLMKDWISQKGQLSDMIDTSIHTEILKKYAYESLYKTESDVLLLHIIREIAGINLINKSRNSLFKTGIIQDNTYGPEFYHLSFKEYYAAEYISNWADDKLCVFINNYIYNNHYREIIIFITGLLRQRNKQAIVLDMLEMNNLSLYMDCLSQRYNFSSEIEDKYSYDFSIDYFNQLRNSYERIIMSNFSKIKNFFFPWCMQEKDLYDKPLAINGNFNANTPSVSFSFDFATDSGNCVSVEFIDTNPKVYHTTEDNTTNEIPIFSLSSSDGNYFYNLDLSGLGLDSAREVAIRTIKSQLKDILENKKLILLENYALNCELLDHLLEKIWVHKDILLPNVQLKKKLSLSKYTVDELLDIINPIMNIRFPYLDHMLRLPVCYFSWYFLKKFKFANINPNDYIIPEADFPQNKPIKYVWESYSDECLIERIKRIYDFVQYEYRKLVECAFPNLAMLLRYYRIGPVKYRIELFRNDNDSSRGGGINEIWEPVENEALSNTEIVITASESKPINVTSHAKIEILLKDISRKLRHFNRYSSDISVKSSLGITGFMTEKLPIRERVYKYLKEDFQKLLGNF